MAIDPIGQGTYKGLAVPLYGESVIRQQNSSNTILTLMNSTANLSAGRLLMGIDYKDVDSDARSSLLTDLAMFDIDGDGGYRVVSGTTVIMEFNTSGIYAGADRILDTSGGMLNRRPVVLMTTGADYEPTEAQSGTLFLTGRNDATSQRILLPANPSHGVWYDFFVSTQDEVGDFQLNTTADSSAELHMPGVTSAVSTASALSPLHKNGVHYARVTALSSVIWNVQCAPGQGAAVTTNLSELDLNQGHWGAGTTV